MDKSLRPKVEEMIEKETPIADFFRIKSGYMYLNGNKYMSFVCDDPDEYVTVYEGRTCTYENEVLITQFLADQLGGSIGDTVKVQSSGSREACMSLIISRMGCTLQEERVDPMIFVLPCVFILMLFFGFSYLKAGKIRKAEPMLLMEE